MDMKLDKPITPKDIVEMSNRLVVPIYQRLFVWEETRIEQLLSDLYDEMPKAEPYDAKPYYIGIITVRDDGNGVWELVDGQQRMTFMTMLGCLLCCRMKDECNDTWRKFVWCDDSQPRIGYVGRDEDLEDIKSLFSAGDARNPNFRAFISAFNRFVKSKTEDQLKVFSNYCYKHASFLVNALPEEYDAYDLNLYFEKMNSTGQQLSPVDIVKGKWFGSRALEWNKCLNFDKAVENSDADAGEVKTNPVLKIEDFFSGDDPEGIDDVATEEKVSKSRLVMRPEVLLLHVLYICKQPRSKNNDETLGSCGYSFDYRKLVEEFSNVIKESNIAIDEFIGKFINELQVYRKWIDKNLIYLKDDGDGAYDYRFRTDADDEDRRNDQDMEANKTRRMMRQFQSMLYVSGGEDQRWVLDAYFEATRGRDRDLTLGILKNQDSLRHKSEAIDANHLTYHTIDRYWFWRLEYLLWERHEGNRKDSLFDCLRDKKEDHDAITHYHFRRDRSIEHLHPQNPSATGESDDWKTDRKDNDDSARNGFGNIAMIASSFNSSQGNDSISTKMGRIDDQVREKRLQSIKLLLMVRSVQSKPQGWTVEAARIHESEMLKLLGVSTAGIQ